MGYTAAPRGWGGGVLDAVLDGGSTNARVDASFTTPL